MRPPLVRLLGLMRLWMRQRTVAPDRKLVSLAGTAACHENMRMVVFRSFEYVIYLIGDFLPSITISNPKCNGALPIRIRW